MSTVSFLTQLDSEILCFPLTYNLNGFKCRLNRHLLIVGSFQRDFLYLFALRFLVTLSLVVAVHGVNPH